MTKSATLTKAELLASKAKHLIGKRVKIQRVDQPIMPQYDFAIGKAGTITNVIPQNAFPISVKLDDIGMTLSFGEEEVELI